MGAAGLEARTALMPWHRFFGASTFVLGAATCCAGFVEKQGFVKCADPANKFCPRQGGGAGTSSIDCPSIPSLITSWRLDLTRAIYFVDM